MPSRKDLQVRVVTRLAAACALLVGLFAPLLFFGMGYMSLRAETLTRAKIKSDILSQRVTAAPHLWQYEEHRLRELLTRDAAPLSAESTVLLDADDRPVLDIGPAVHGPAIRVTSEIFDSGEVAGRIEVARSLRGLLAWTGLVAFIGMALGAATFITLRVLPLRLLERTTQALLEEKERAEVTLHSIGDAVITVDAQERLEYLNPAAERLTGWSLAEALGKPVSSVFRLVDEATLEPVDSPIRRAFAENRIIILPAGSALIRRDGRVVPVEDSAGPIHGSGAGPTGVVLVFRDVSQARHLASELSWQASHDALTGLVNRLEFERRLDAAIQTARSQKQPAALCYVDLDHFKIVNDTCGHGAGDELLRQVAGIFQARIRSADTVARLGGDEFGLLLPACSAERAMGVAESLLERLGAFQFTWEDRTFSIGASMGLVGIDETAGSRVALLKAADSACYLAKELGRNRIQVGGQRDREPRAPHGEMDWASRIGKALANDGFVLYWQPCVPLSAIAPRPPRGEILVRMLGDDGELLLPGSFIPAAERHSVMPEIDRWVIRKALEVHGRLASGLGPLAPEISVNLSGASLGSEELLTFIQEEMRSRVVGQGALCLEIPETAVLNNLHQAIRLTQELGPTGILFCLDDFGFGMNSFSYVRRLLVDRVKIDGALICDIAHDHRLARGMVTAINSFAHVLGLSTIAKRVETESVREALAAMGVDYAQGHAIGRPEPLADLESRLLSAHRAPEAKVETEVFRGLTL